MTKERSQREHITLGRAGRDPLSSFIVKRFTLKAGHVGRRYIINALREHPKDVSFGFNAGIAETVRAQFVLKKAVDFSWETLCRLQFRSVDDFLGALHRLDVIAGFERDECPAAVYLFRKPEDVTATINAANFPLEHGAIFPRPRQSTRSKTGACSLAR